jgi:hypothetical protein
VRIVSQTLLQTHLSTFVLMLLFVSSLAASSSLDTVMHNCWRGILDKFWDLCQRRSKSKRQLEDGLECTMGADVKESKSTTKGCATK